MKYLFALLLAILLIPTYVTAQSLAPDISIEVAPGNPRPEQTTTLTARSFGSNLSQLTLSWTYNGSPVAQGVGKTSIQVVAPKAGVTGTITVTTSEGASATAVLRPGSIDLLWEAVDAYTPPFYKGKALLPVGGLLKVTAIPATGATTGQSFTWQRNGQAVESQSGYGKASVIVRNDALNPNERISVSVGSGAFTASNTLSLNPYAPQVLAYENKDGYVEYTRGYASSIPLTKGGALLRFEPYYFSVPQNIARDLSTTITINKEPLVTSIPNQVALSRPDTGGQGALEIMITTATYSLQHLQKTFTLLFN